MEDCPVFNPDGREMVARENEISAKTQRKPAGGTYFGCHTDITIPYSELDTIEAIHPDGTSKDHRGRTVCAAGDGEAE